MRQCLRLAGHGLEMQNEAAEVKLRAERRAGGMLSEMEKSVGGRPRKTDAIVSLVSEAPTLAELEVTPKQSSRWQQEAEVPPEVFEQYVAETKANDEELTSAGLLRITKKLRQAKEREETAQNVLDTDDIEGPYRTIVIDPPWPVQKILRDVRPNQDVFDYPTVTVEDIPKPPVAA